MTREEQVISILQRRGHISEGTAFVELGRVQVASAIWRIKNQKPHLIPAGQKIVTVHKVDTAGKRYVEWQLKAAA
nr:hypothetical protein [uncultured Sphingomonas sp.]